MQGGGFGAAPALSPAVFVSHPELATHMQEVKVTLDVFCQEMKGAPIEFGGNSFQGLDSCIAWARTALGLLANLKETREVKRACQVEATSIKSVVDE